MHFSLKKWEDFVGLHGQSPDIQILWLIKVSDKFYWLGLFALDMALQA